VTTPKSVNRSVYEGADHIALRLRAAKKPAVIPFLEIPPEEIDLEPMTIEPVSLTDAEPVPIVPLIVPMDDIMPYDEDEDDVPTVVPFPAQATSTPPPASTPTAPPTTATGPLDNPTPADGLSLFGVGVIETKARGKRR
jgi:hypothetical protein